MVALSFDDGPVAGVTDKILTILQKYNVRATFFVCGWRFSKKENQEMLRRMAALGCEIGNHTWSHADLNELNCVTTKQEIENTNKAVFDAAGVRPRCFRPPGGVNGFDTGRVTRENGMYIVLWSQSGNVHEVDPKRIAQNVEKQIVDGKELHAGDVILLHDTKGYMVDAVEIIVPKLLKEGYQLVTVWELLNCSGEPLVPGELYQK
jgi:peptidoglycan/xylan/chitin deacetylase (PgdA/CDA1 family)